MDPDTQALLTVTRGHTKAARRQLSTLARLLAQLDERLGELETDGHLKEDDHDGTTEHD